MQKMSLASSVPANSVTSKPGGTRRPCWTSWAGTAADRSRRQRTANKGRGGFMSIHGEGKSSGSWGSVLIMRCTIKTSCFIGSACAGIAPAVDTAPSAGVRPDCSQGAGEDHLGGGNVPVDDEAARALVDALGKALRGYPPAGR